MNYYGSTKQLFFPSASATGSTGQTINTPAGMLTSGASQLGRTSEPSALQVPVETMTLLNSLISADSVVVASVTAQCNIDTAVQIRSISTGAGTVDFEMCNTGIGDCTNEHYSISFIVLS